MSGRPEYGSTRLIRVVVVDDNPLVRCILLAQLNEHPELEVVGTAVDGHDGLRVVGEMQPDVVLTDLEMPEMNGAEFVREQMQRQPTPILVVSGLDPESPLVAEALGWGALEMIRKPQRAADVVHQRIQLTESIVRAGRQATSS